MIRKAMHLENVFDSVFGGEISLFTWLEATEFSETFCPASISPGLTWINFFFFPSHSVFLFA